MALVLGSLATILRLNDEDFARRLKQAQQDFAGAGERMTAGAAIVGAAIAAGLGAGLVAALDMDKAKARLAAQLGGSAEYAADMGKIAGAVYARGFGESAQLVGDAVRAVLSSGILAEDATDAAIESTTIKATALAQVFDQDVTAAARAAGQMIRTGMAGDASEAFDLLTRGFQQSGDHAGDLLDTVSEYSTKFRDLGLSGAEALGLLQQGLQAGARDADTVADALKEFAIRAVDGSKASSEGYKALGLNAEKMGAQIAKGGTGAQKGLDVVLDRLRAMKDPVAQDAAAVALFGTKAEDLGDALYSLDVTSAANQLGDVAGAADKLGETLEESSSQKLESFKRKAQAALVDKLAEALPVLISVGGWIERNSDFVTALAVILGTIAGIIGIVTLATKAWAAAQMILNIVMMLNPIGLIILIVIGLIAVFVGLWMKFEGFRNFWKGAWDLIWGAIKFVWDWIRDNWPLLLAIITGPVGMAVFLINKYWDQIKGGATAAKDWVVGKFQALLSWVTGMKSRVASGARGLWDGIVASFRSAINRVISLWNNFSLTLGGGSVLGMNIPSVTLNTPNIPHLATGGDVLQSGLAVIHRGERVTPAAKVSRAGGSDGHAEALMIRVILQYPDGRVIKDQLIDAASLRGQPVGGYLGIPTS